MQINILYSIKLALTLNIKNLIHQFSSFFSFQDKTKKL